MKERLLMILAWGIFGTVIACCVGTIVLVRVTAQLDFTAILDSLNALITAFAGALIASRRSRNPIGWILLMIGGALAFTTFSEPLVVYIWSLGFDVLTNAIGVVWLSQWVWTVPMLGVTLLLYLFPTGRLVTPRWRWVFLGSVLANLVVIGWLAILTPFELETPQQTTIELANPVGLVPWSDSPAQIAFLFALIVIPLVLALASMLVRFVGSRGVEREQMKWFMYAAALFIIGLSVSFVTEDPIAPVLVTVLAFGMPIAVAIALFRYRLYDIDLIIRRTLTYALVVALLAIVYFGTVIVLQQIFANLTGLQGNEIITVLSTLAIAALFIPLRNRIQGAIDRRFYRRKYDAQQVLQEFGKTVRDETDLDKLVGRLMEVVNETMQPKSVSVWLSKDRERQVAEK